MLRIFGLARPQSALHARSSEIEVARPAPRRSRATTAYSVCGQMPYNPAGATIWSGGRCREIGGERRSARLPMRHATWSREQGRIQPVVDDTAGSPELFWRQRQFKTIASSRSPRCCPPQPGSCPGLALLRGFHASQARATSGDQFLRPDPSRILEVASPHGRILGRLQPTPSHSPELSPKSGAPPRPTPPPEPHPSGHCRGKTSFRR